MQDWPLCGKREFSMNPDLLSRLSESKVAPDTLLDGWHLREPEKGFRNLQLISKSLTSPAVSELIGPLSRILPRQADPDMALNNLERFLAQPAGKNMLPLLLEGRARGLEILLQLLSTSQFFADLLIANPDDFEIARIPLRRSPTVAELIEQLRAEVQRAGDDTAILRTFRRFRQKHQLRIGVNDVIRDRSLEEITKDLSNVAEASVEVALETTLHKLTERFGKPMTLDREPSKSVILAFGKLGGEELNYSSDIDLMYLFDEEGMTEGRRSTLSNDEFYARVMSEVIRLLSSHTDRGQAYRVDLRLRPEGQQGSIARSLESTLSYYDTLGRTWERQALIKVRPVAGDMELGWEFLRAVEPFVYRRYLSFAEINEIKAMKRRIEQRSTRRGVSEREVKTGQGGIRDIEFTIQFLQLLNGGDPEMVRIRRRNTLVGMQELEAVGCLTDPELRALDDGYRFLRKTEHRLQLLFDLQTHLLPESPEGMHKLALRMGYSPPSLPKVEEESNEEDETPEEEVSNEPPASGETRTPNAPQRLSLLDEPTMPPLDTRQLLIEPMDRFLHDYREKTRLNRTILNHLLHQTFPDSDEQAEPESDLILTPDEDEATIRMVLGRYPFRDVMGAHRNLLQLAQEAGPFLSTRRCRHFLASIAPQLLRAVAETPDPDLALLNLEKVTAMLGAKAVLWELFSLNQPSLKLYVDLCSNSPFLSEILINNPGMIDDLLDSLILNRPRTRAELQAELKELGRGVEKAEFIEPILRSFQDKELLRIGVRDLLGKDSIRETTAALSDLAETILGEVTARQELTLQERFGTPQLTNAATQTECHYALLSLGKLGGREMSYHSDLDLILVYEGDGQTNPGDTSSPSNLRTSIDNHQYFTEFAQRIIKATSHMGPMGKLYAVDMKLRPTGKSGSLVIPLCEFRRYFESAEGMVWERQSLTRTRVVAGDLPFGEIVMTDVRTAIHRLPWSSAIIDEIQGMRTKLESSASPRSLKRAAGGMVDVEFLVQMFQIKYGTPLPQIACTNTWDSLDALQEVGLLSPEDAQILLEGYSFLRRVEARLRIVTNRSLNEYPENREDLQKLARRLGLETPASSAAEQLRKELSEKMQAIRKCYQSLMQRERLKSE